MSIVVLCNPHTRRVETLVQALASLGLSEPKLVSYLDFLSNKIDLRQYLTEGSSLRLESPGKDFEVERQILMLGAGSAEETDGRAISKSSLAKIEYTRGEILAPRQWYYGWCHLLKKVESALEACASKDVINSTTDIASMYDKPTCQKLLHQAQIRIPETFGVIKSYGELQELITRTGTRRLFLKLANGSSASGVLAYQTNGKGKEKVITTVEMESDSATGTRLFNSRKIRQYERTDDIVRLIDALGRHYLFVEQWIPKASIADKVFDLRVVVIGGIAKHAVVRLSRTPITNLNLLNERMSIERAKELLPSLPFQAIARECENAMRTVFPSSSYAGFDVLPAHNLKDFAIAEVNAFGDHLNGVLHEGLSTHQAEYQFLSERPSFARTVCHA